MILSAVLCSFSAKKRKEKFHLLKINLGNNIRPLQNKGDRQVFYNSGNKKKIKFLKSKKAELINVKLNNDGDFDLRKIMSILYQKNICFLLVEGGNELTSKMIDKNLFNEFYLIKTDNIV